MQRAINWEVRAFATMVGGDALPPSTGAEYNDKEAWRFARRVEAWIVALEHYQIATTALTAALAAGQWEHRDAASAAMGVASQEVGAAADAFEIKGSLIDAMNRALGHARSAQAWGLAQHLTELLPVVGELEQWLEQKLKVAGYPGPVLAAPEVNRTAK